MPQNLPVAVTAATIAALLGVPLHRVNRVLETRHYIQPVCLAGRTRVYNNDAIALVRHALNAIDARQSAVVPDA